MRRMNTFSIARMQQARLPNFLVTHYSATLVLSQLSAFYDIWAEMMLKGLKLKLKMKIQQLERNWGHHTITALGKRRIPRSSRSGQSYSLASPDNQIDV